MLLQGFNFSAFTYLVNKLKLKPRTKIMSTTNNGTAREDAVRSALLHYIKNELARDIIKLNMKPYRHIRLVSYQDGVVGVMIGGEDPQTNSKISRDVFIDGFVGVYVWPLILKNFPDVNAVAYVKTTDEGFDGIVQSLGGNVSYADYWETLHSFQQCMHLFRDNSPFV